MSPFSASVLALLPSPSFRDMPLGASAFPKPATSCLAALQNTVGFVLIQLFMLSACAHSQVFLASLIARARAFLALVRRVLSAVVSPASNLRS